MLSAHDCSFYGYFHKTWTYTMIFECPLFFPLSSRDPAPWRERLNKGATLHGLSLQLDDPSTANGAELLRVPLAGEQPLPSWQQHSHAPPLFSPCRAQLPTASPTSWRYKSGYRSSHIKMLTTRLPPVLSVSALLWQQPAPPQDRRL